MKPSILLILTLCFFAQCKKNDDVKNSNSTGDAQLQDEVSALQSQIRSVSSTIEGKVQLENKNYTSSEVQSEIQSFNSLRNLQKIKVAQIYSMGAKPKIELLQCADFEDISCVVEEWDVNKYNFQTVRIDSSDSYNKTGSLYISNPFDSTRFNQYSVGMVGYVNGIEEKTVYKIRWWAKIKGNTTKDNGRNLSISIRQDAEYLGDGGNLPGNGKFLNDGWVLYSFQVISRTNSPFKVQLHTNMQDCWIDDIHIVKKTN